MRTRITLLVVAVAVLVTGCVSNDFPEGLRCDDRDCPPGQTCGPDNICRVEHIDAGQVDASSPDAAFDAALGDDAGALGTVTVTRAGTGNGGVVSNPFGINCGSTCSAGFAAGTTITMTATPESDSTFTGWSGAGCSGTETCVFDSDGTDVTVTASFAVAEYALTVATGGDGIGGVSSLDDFIDCPTNCTKIYSHGTAVTLEAAATGAASFGGWSGDCSGLTTTCLVTMDAAKNVTASFDLDSFTLGVSLAGSGAGSVVSNVGDINCPAGDCADSYSAGSEVTLTAAPDATSIFTGWSGGGCSDTGSCAVVVNSATSVTATFTRITYDLTVVKDSTNGGDGLVTSAPTGINCASDCAEIYDADTAVALNQAAIDDAVFTGWAGDCTGAGACNLIMDGNKSVTAAFCSPRDCGATECGDVDDGCGGTMSCGACCDLATHECVEPAPAPWSGPVAISEAAGTATPTSCTPEYPSLIGDYGFDLTEPGGCDCSCDPATGLTCNNATLRESDNSSCVEISPDEQVIAPGACDPIGDLMRQDDYYKFLDPGTTGGSCAEVLDDSLEDAVFANQSRVCSGATSGGVCATAGQFCAPQAPANFDSQLCIYQADDNACPAGPYSDYQLRHADLTDSRSCGACSCGAVDGSCTASIGFRSQCGGGGVIYAWASPGACQHVDDPVDYLYFGTSTSGSCTASEGSIDGAATALTPVTLCCLP